MKDNLFQMSELEALLGDYKDDFDVDGIIEDATGVDANGNRYWTVFGDDLNEVIAGHDKANGTAKVYVWWDNDIRGYRYDLTPVVNPERVDTIKLPDGWVTYETEAGEVFVTESDLDDLSESEIPHAWTVTHFGRGNDPLDGHYALKEKSGKHHVSVKTI